jgi:hypothetical protein
MKRVSVSAQTRLTGYPRNLNVICHKVHYGLVKCNALKPCINCLLNCSKTTIYKTLKHTKTHFKINYISKLVCATYPTSLTSSIPVYLWRETNYVVNDRCEDSDCVYPLSSSSSDLGLDYSDVKTNHYITVKIETKQSAIGSIGIDLSSYFIKTRSLYLECKHKLLKQCAYFCYYCNCNFHIRVHRRQRIICDVQPDWR